MSGPLVPPKPGPHLTIERIDNAIRVAHADLTWRSPTEQQVVWAAIDNLLDRRITLTGRRTDDLTR